MENNRNKIQNIPTRELKHMISAVSYHRDSVLLSKHLDPEELRKEFRKIRTFKNIDDVQFAIHEFPEEFKGVYLHSIGMWVNDAIGVPIDECVFVLTHSYNTDDDEYISASSSQTDTFHVVYSDPSGRLRVTSCSIDILIENSFKSRCIISRDARSIPPFHNLESLIKEYDSLVEVLGEKYTYKSLIISL